MSAASSLVLHTATSAARTRVVRPTELSFDQLAAWKETVAVDPALRSPFFQPEFTQAIARVRDDVEVAVIEEEDVPVAFFPYQRGKSGFGLPVGGKLNDFHGMIGKLPESLSLQAILKQCNLASWSFDHLLDSQAHLASSPVRRSASRYIEFSNGWAAYQESRIQAGSSIIRETRRKQRKLARDFGEIRFEFDADEDLVFDQLLSWKSAQRRKTKTFDVLQMDWARRVLENLRTVQSEQFRGCLSALYAGDQLIAAHFGLISKDVLHLWFPAYCVQFANYSPGVGLMLKMVEEAEERGITRFDLGKGEERFKQRLANGSMDVLQGAVSCSAWANCCSHVYGFARKRAGQLPFQGLVKRSKRWLDSWVYR